MACQDGTSLVALASAVDDQDILTLIDVGNAEKSLRLPVEAIIKIWTLSADGLLL